MEVSSLVDILLLSAIVLSLLSLPTLVLLQLLLPLQLLLLLPLLFLPPPVLHHCLPFGPSAHSQPSKEGTGALASSSLSFNQQRDRVQVGCPKTRNKKKAAYCETQQHS